MSNSEQDKRFKKHLTDFVNGGKENESHAEAHKAIFDTILQSERARRGFDDDPERWAEIDAETIRKILTSDTDDPRLVLAEKALKDSAFATNPKSASLEQIRDLIEISLHSGR